VLSALCARIAHLALPTPCIGHGTGKDTATVPVKTVIVPVTTEKSKAFQKLERTYNWFGSCANLDNYKHSDYNTDLLIATLGNKSQLTPNIT
jgi:hypothetical protein